MRLLSEEKSRLHLRRWRWYTGSDALVVQHWSIVALEPLFLDLTDSYVQLLVDLVLLRSSLRSSCLKSRLYSKAQGVVIPLATLRRQLKLESLT